MKLEKIELYGDEVVDQFMSRQMKCPYHQGKIKLQKITRWGKEKIIEAIDALKGKDFTSMSYDELLVQNNQEKNMEYQLTHEVISVWIKHAYEYYAPQIPTEMVYEDIYKIAFISLEDGMQILREAFDRINLHIKEQLPEVYPMGNEYGVLKKQLAKNGCRQAGQGKPENAFDQLTDPMIMEQLVVQTIPYIQYLAVKYYHDQTFVYRLQEAKAPKARHFLANLGGNLMRFIRNYLPRSENFPAGELYDESRPYGLSQEATERLEDIMQVISKESFTYKTYRKMTGDSDRNLTLPDEAIYGCPVKDAFTKFFHITVAALYQAGKEPVKKV